MENQKKSLREFAKNCVKASVRNSGAGKTDIEQKALHDKFVALGRKRSKISHELIALLPQIYDTQTYKSFGCASIYEYAAIYGDGLSSGVVTKALKLKETLKDCPKLFDAVKTQGVHKIAIVSKLARPENEKELVDVVENMSKSAVQEYSKMRRGKKNRENMKIELDEEMMFMFLKLKNRLRTNSNKETLKRLLSAMNEQFFPGEKFSENAGSANFGSEKNEMGSAGDVGSSGDAGDVRSFEDVRSAGDKKEKSRYISVPIRRETIRKTNGRCAYPCCIKPISVFHHVDGYAKTKSHDSLVGLCKIHHEFAHNGVGSFGVAKSVLSKTDLLYREKRRLAVGGG